MKRIIEIEEKDYNLVCDLVRNVEPKFCRDRVYKAIASGIPYEERPEGEWVYEYDDFYRCSICGRSICTEWDKLSLKKYYPFCHCGADMRGGIS